jgi:hypothetical protein
LGTLPKLNFLENRIYFIFFEKTCQSGGGTSGFWKLLFSLENNFQRLEVLIISLVFFSVFNSVSPNRDRFFKDLQVPYRRPSRFSTSHNLSSHI